MGCMKVKFILRERPYFPEGKGKYKLMIGEKAVVPFMPELNIGEIVAIERRLFDNQYSVCFPNRQYPGAIKMTFSEGNLDRVSHSSIEELLGITAEDSWQ